MELQVTKLNSFPPNSNPFHHELQFMRVPISFADVNDWMVMHSSGQALRESIIIVHIPSGQRLEIRRPFPDLKGMRAQINQTSIQGMVVATSNISGATFYDFLPDGATESGLFQPNELTVVI